MRIHFIGLSCFLIENKQGFRILVDPFNNAPEWKLGPDFPAEFEGKPFGANIVLSSQPDADHAYAPGDWLQHAPPTQPNSNPFPGLNVKGTVIYEYSGDLNIAWNYTVDGIRLAHFADNAHLLTDEQIAEVGSVDIVFMSPPKVKTKKDLEVVRKNIAALQPTIIIWAHHLAPKNLPKTEDSETLRKFFVSYFRDNAGNGKFYKDENSFMELCSILENAFTLNQEYSGVIVGETSVEIDEKTLEQAKDKPVSFLFRSMLASSSTDMEYK